MTHPDYLKDKARQLRRERKLTIDQIAERLSLSRSTVFHWVRDMPIERKLNPGQELAVLAMQAKFQLLREEAYAEGANEYVRLTEDPTFRDFVCMYIGEGSKRKRNTVEICNSDPLVIALGVRWLRRLSRRKVSYRLQFHADQDLVEIVRFWSGLLDVPSEEIKLQRKSNSNALTGRTWRSRYGILAVETNDTLLRAKLQAWMDTVRKDWALTHGSPPIGDVSSV